VIIESIKITNFRQFYGDVYLPFSTDNERNVTVVHGANGSGKTSLLNAFKWCFYDQTDFDTANENILNEAAIQDSDDRGFIDISVEVVFEDEGVRYGAIRKQRFRKIGPVSAEQIEQSKFVLNVTASDGETNRSKTPSADLQSILPKDLQPYFFFNGERIEHIAGVNQSHQIRDAIRKLMGLEIVDRAVLHMEKVRNGYRKDLCKEVTAEHKNILDEISALENDINLYGKKVTEEIKNKESAESDIFSIDSELKLYEKSREFQARRIKLDEQYESNKSNIDGIKSEQKALICKSGFLLFSDDIFDKCNVLIEKNRKKGVLPYGIKEQFIDDRIEIGTCICGTAVLKGSNEHTCLLETRKNAGSDDLESSYTSVSALLKVRDHTVSEHVNSYKLLSHKLKGLFDANDEIRKEVGEISAQLTSTPDDRIAALEKKRTHLHKSRDNAIRDGGIAESDREQAERDKVSKELLKNSLNDQIGSQNIANKRMDKASSLVDTLGKLRESLAQQVRKDLSLRVDETFQSIIRKPVRAIIDDGYKLQVLKRSTTGEEYVVNEQSTGERQVTSLSFISSIIALAKDKHGRQGPFFQGGLYPLVMDSPFGALDDDYREKIAGSVSELAEQVIMFVSNSQWEGKVKLACEGKVGKSYRLVYHTPKGVEKETEYVKASENKYEYSTLEEV